MANTLFAGTYINEKENKSYPVGTPSPGYDASGKVIPATMATRSKYIDPKTGTYFKTPEEYGNYVATKIPVSSDVPKYAGDAITKPDQSAIALQGTARNLNNARNDIAVGATDPYGAGNKSGIAYSPQELSAIEKAYAGIYDPALNDVFARLKTKQDEEDAAAKRDEMIFSTNESIRQWKATTGSKIATGENSTGEWIDDPNNPNASIWSAGTPAKSLFTQTQLNNGARNAGMTIDGFSKIDTDLQNFFVAPPTDIDPDTGKSYPMNKTFDNLVAQAKSGDMKTADAAAEIEASNLPETVKHYYIDQLPLTDVEKQGYWSNIWSSLWGK